MKLENCRCIETMNIKSKISEAFCNIKRPSNNELTNGSCSCSDCSLNISDLQNKKWDTIEFQDLLKIDDESFFTIIGKLSPKAFHYFFPEIITFILDDPEAADVLSSGILDYFTNDGISSSTSEVENTIRCFDQKQKEVLVDFINYLRKYEGLCPHIIDSAISNIKTGTVRQYSQKKVMKWAGKMMERHKNT